VRLHKSSSLYQALRSQRADLSPWWGSSRMIIELVAALSFFFITTSFPPTTSALTQNCRFVHSFSAPVTLFCFGETSFSSKCLGEVPQAEASQQQLLRFTNKHTFSPTTAFSPPSRWITFFPTSCHSLPIRRLQIPSQITPMIKAFESRSIMCES
jgi:hypothetical protein